MAETTLQYRLTVAHFWNLLSSLCVELTGIFESHISHSMCDQTCVSHHVMHNKHVQPTKFIFFFTLLTAESWCPLCIRGVSSFARSQIEAVKGGSSVVQGRSGGGSRLWIEETGDRVLSNKNSPSVAELGGYSMYVFMSFYCIIYVVGKVLDFTCSISTFSPVGPDNSATSRCILKRS